LNYIIKLTYIIPKLYYRTLSKIIFTNMSCCLSFATVAKNRRLVKTIAIHNFLIPSDFNKDHDFNVLAN